MPRSTVSRSWQSIFIGICEDSRCIPRALSLVQWPSPPPISQGGKQTVGAAESLISETSHQKDSLHTPDHNIILGGIHIRYPLHGIKTLRDDVTQCRKPIRKITTCSILTYRRGNKPEESRLKRSLLYNSSTSSLR